MSNSAQSRSTILGLGLVGMLGILAGLSWFTFNYAKGSAYLSDEPQACANCHVMRDQFTAWQHSSHARVASCNDCHTPHGFPDKWLVKALNGFNHSAVFSPGGFTNRSVSVSSRAGGGTQLCALSSGAREPDLCFAS